TTSRNNAPTFRNMAPLFRPARQNPSRIPPCRRHWPRRQSRALPFMVIQERGFRDLLSPTSIKGADRNPVPPAWPLTKTRLAEIVPVSLGTWSMLSLIAPPSAVEQPSPPSWLHRPPAERHIPGHIALGPSSVDVLPCVAASVPAWLCLGSRCELCQAWRVGSGIAPKDSLLRPELYCPAPRSR
ncbi:hypothetical protein C8A00DRAFT_18810, partial [Chaetomidium leptoderma]